MKTLIAFLLVNTFPVNSYTVKFVNCYDGDTCTFNVTVSDMTYQSGLEIEQRSVLIRTNQKVRLCDINAPELKPGPNPAAIKARNDLISWITNANELVLEVPQKEKCEYNENSCDEYEKYGRLLGYILADGVNLNKKQLSAGNAVPFIQCQ